MRWLLLCWCGVALGQAPKFVVQPLDTELRDGDQLVLVALTSPLASYQWWRDGSVLEASTNFFLKEVDAVEADAGKYWLVASNSAGMATSRVASVSYAPCVRFFADNRLVANVTGFTNWTMLRMISSVRGEKIYYTTNGSEPTVKSAVYKTPIKVANTMLVRVMVDGREYVPLKIVKLRL